MDQTETWHFYQSFEAMSSETDSEVDSEVEHLSIEELKTWRVNDLKQWLSKYDLKKSGTKDILVNRVYRAMTNCEDSGSANNEDTSDTCVPIKFVLQPWKALDLTDIPEISAKDIDSYFMYNKHPTTGEHGNFERQMKKAKRFCNEGFIREIEYNGVKPETSYCYIRCKCLPSMRQTVQVGNAGKTATCYSLHICINKKTGLIKNAVCDCKAGEAGLCAHVGALLNTIRKTKSACTTKECTWDRPRPIERKPSPKRVSDITFLKTDKDKKTEKLKPYPGVYKAEPCQEQTCNKNFLADMLAGLKDAYPESVLYQTCTAKPANIDLFLKLFSPSFCYADNQDLQSPECLRNFNSFLENLIVTAEVSENLEKGTRGQHVKQNWKRARCNLITASVMGDVVRRIKINPDNLVKKICGYTTIPDSVKSLAYGRKYESVAVDHYMKDHLKRCGDVRVQFCGLLVNPKYPFLGASVDGLVTCAECGTGLVEVKCPYGSDSKQVPWRNLLPEECGSDLNFFCIKDCDGKLFLKKNHNYMYQVQGQLAIYELEWVDFVVWTKKGVSIERINFSEDVWNTMFPKLKEFYVRGVVPELFSNRVERGKSLY